MDSDFSTLNTGDGRSVSCLSRVEMIEGENMRVKDSTGEVWIVVKRSRVPFNCFVELCEFGYVRCVDVVKLGLMMSSKEFVVSRFPSSLSLCV